MARPKKEEGSTDACQRLADAFWNLLETNKVNEITVGNIAAKAGLNRGTFYYHFDDINDMITKIIKQEMFRDNFVPKVIFNIVTGIEAEYSEMIEEFVDGYCSKVGLLLEKGGSDLVSVKIKSILLEMWAALLCKTEENMHPSTRLLIEYSVSGILGLIVYIVRQENPKKLMMESREFREALPNFFLSQIAREEGLTKDEILSRIMMMGRLTNISPE